MEKGQTVNGGSSVLARYDDAAGLSQTTERLA